MRTNIAVLLVCGLSMLAMGCAKAKPLTPQQQQANALTSTSLALQLPVPDNSYASRTKTTSALATTNVGLLVSTLVDPACAALKELNSHFSQTVTDGQGNADSSDFVLASVGSELSVTSDLKAQKATFTYNLAPYKPYFTGSVTLDGTSGHIDIPSIASIAPAASVDFKLAPAKGASGLVRTVTVNSSTNGVVVFTETMDTTGKITLVNFSYQKGAGTATGYWMPGVGGVFTDFAGTKYCFDANLVDTSTNCPAQPTPSGPSGTSSSSLSH